MKLRQFTAVAAPIAAAVAIASSGVAHADTAIPEVGYSADLVGNNVITTLTNGVFELSGKSVNVKDTAGNTVVSLPLTFRQDGVEYTMPAMLADSAHTLDITAIKDVSSARPVEVQPIASPTENSLAMQTFSSQFGIATAIGAFIGTALGALVGLTGIVAGPGVVASVIAGAAIGGIIGTLVVGGPALLVAGLDLVGTLTAAPGTTKFNEKK
ncbi:ammonium transporter [Nocardia sp. SYP-A9097]|uniref:ammonium transporter n=1 Tax=Nocardia sp. SYP-A9097 TaxID=2663237 RepID=UPI00129BF4D5|nr:ammonium transporter [Nocardia sp. SYP-A9097]MRH91371.1 ammonium transporter [Nocardia sp. SYP-A9097]